MKMMIMAVIVLTGVWFCGYQCGKSQVKTQIVYKQAKDMKNVVQKRAKIQAAPNARRDELLKLMHAGRL